MQILQERNRISNEIWMIGIVWGNKTPTDLGLRDGNKFKEVPKTPNCVSTQADPNDAEHYMAPWPIHSPQHVINQLLQSLFEFGRTKVLVNKDDYIHVVFTTGLARFRDDVEFYIDRSNNIIHFRSASRVGRGDMGTNRKRMVRLKELYDIQTQKQQP